MNFKEINLFFINDFSRNDGLYGVQGAARIHVTALIFCFKEKKKLVRVRFLQG